MAVSKKIPASAGTLSQRKPVTKSPVAKQASVKETTLAPEKSELKTSADENAAAQKLPQEPVTKKPKKPAKAETKNSKSDKKAVQQAKDDLASAAKNKSKMAKEKPKKSKLVRDSFTMPDNEYQAIGDIKRECIKAGFAIKKSEVLRIGVALLKKMPASQIQQALSLLPALKAGRPKKEGVEVSSA